MSLMVLQRANKEDASNEGSYSTWLTSTFCTSWSQNNKKIYCHTSLGTGTLTEGWVLNPGLRQNSWVRM